MGKNKSTSDSADRQPRSGASAEMHGPSPPSEQSEISRGDRDADHAVSELIVGAGASRMDDSDEHPTTGPDRVLPQLITSSPVSSASEAGVASEIPQSDAEEISTTLSSRSELLEPLWSGVISPTAESTPAAGGQFFARVSLIAADGISVLAGERRDSVDIRTAAA